MSKHLFTTLSNPIRKLILNFTLINTLKRGLLIRMTSKWRDQPQSKKGKKPPVLVLRREANPQTKNKTTTLEKPRSVSATMTTIIIIAGITERRKTLGGIKKKEEISQGLGLDQDPENTTREIQGIIKTHTPIIPIITLPPHSSLKIKGGKRRRGKPTKEVLNK
jgi:hypothetical protein